MMKTGAFVSFSGGEKKLGIKGSPTHEVVVDNVRLPADRLLGERGAGMGIATRTINHTRGTIAAQAIGIAQGGPHLAPSYVKGRPRLGKFIADFQGIQFVLADMAMTLKAARQLTDAASARSERGAADLRYFSAAAKCSTSDTAMAVTVDAVPLLGGSNYTCDFPVERRMRDAKITHIYEGTNQVQHIVLARELLKATR